MQTRLDYIAHAPYAAPQSGDPVLTRGDLSGDGNVNASDAAQVLIAAASAGAGNGYGLDDAHLAAADVNGVDGVNASDAALILIYAAVEGAGGVPDWSSILRK